MAERLYNVVIEHPRSPAPGAAATLAAAISARYGIPAADLERRISRGRFRVKSRVDRTTADTYATDLNRLGAVCIVQPADDGPGAASSSGDGSSGTQPAVRRETAPPPGTEPGRPRLAPETLPPVPSTDPGRPRFSPDSLQPATDPGRPRFTESQPATDPSRPRVSAVAAAAAQPATDPSRPRVAADAVRPATDPGRARVAAEPARPATDPSRQRVPQEAARPAPEPPRAAAPLPSPPYQAAPAPQQAAPPSPPPAAASAHPLDLGALSGGFPLTLSTLDGAAPDGGAAEHTNQSGNLPASFGPAANLPASFGPAANLPASFGPAANLPASFGPAASPEPAPAPSPSSSGSRLPRAEPSPPPGPGPARALAVAEPVVDRFAPPPAAAVDVEVALDTDTRRRRETPPDARTTTGRVQEVPWPAATLPPRISDASARAGAGRSAGANPSAGPASGLRDPRVRLVLGAALAVGLGFVPAHFVGAMREKTAFAAIDADLANPDRAHSAKDYDLARERKHSARKNIALGSLALWAIVGGGVAWLWFRRIDWDHLLGPTR